MGMGPPGKLFSGFPQGFFVSFPLGEPLDFNQASRREVCLEKGDYRSGPRW